MIFGQNETRVTTPRPRVHQLWVVLTRLVPLNVVLLATRLLMESLVSVSKQTIPNFRWMSTGLRIYFRFDTFRTPSNSTLIFQDINECTTDELWKRLKSVNTGQPCSSFDTCVNKVGTFECCTTGYQTLNGLTCVGMYNFPRMFSDSFEILKIWPFIWKTLLFPSLHLLQTNL